MIQAPGNRLRFRAMTEADLPIIDAVDFAASRGPEAWIAWNRRTYAEHECELFSNG